MRETINPTTTIWYRCHKCERSFFIRNSDKEKKLLHKSMRCPNYIRCKGQINKRAWAHATEIKNYRWATALDLYQATAGLGFSNERECSPDVVKDLLYGYRITNVELFNTADPKKSLLLSLTLETGKVIHLASSTQGPIVYKVTEVSNGG